MKSLKSKTSDNILENLGGRVADPDPGTMVRSDPIKKKPGSNLIKTSGSGGNRIRVLQRYCLNRIRFFFKRARLKNPDPDP